MIDAAVEWRRRGEAAFFVCPRPRRPFLSAGTQPSLLDVLDVADPERAVTRVSAPVDVAYELGTEQYRANVILRLVQNSVPPGTPLVLSDEPAIWRAASELASTHPVVGVLHADDEHYYQLAERYLDRLAALVGVSGRVVERVSQRLRLGAERVHRIPCGIPLPPPVTRDASPSTQRLIWVGRIEERQKRVSDLPAILVALRSRGVDATLDVVGDGPDTAALRETVERAGVNASVTWHGWSAPSAVHRLLAKADVLLLPSNFEGMPVAVMEALAAGCGVAATSVSGLEDYATHPLTAHCYRTYPVGDVDAAVRAVAELLETDPERRASSARALAESEFSIERCVSRYAALPLEPVARAAGSRPWPALGRLTGLASLPIAALRRARLWWSGVMPQTSCQGTA